MIGAVVFYYLFKWVEHFDSVLNRPSTINDNATSGVKCSAFLIPNCL